MNKKQLAQKLEETTDKHLDNFGKQIDIITIRNTMSNTTCPGNYLNSSRVINFLNGCDSVLKYLEEEGEKLTRELAITQRLLDEKTIRGKK